MGPMEDEMRETLAELGGAEWRGKMEMTKEMGTDDDSAGLRVRLQMLGLDGLTREIVMTPADFGEFCNMVAKAQRDSIRAMMALG